MGIRVKNLHNYICELKVTKTLTATQNAAVDKIPFSGFITNIVAKVSDGGTGSTASFVDIHKNGVTIFDQATKMTFAATTGTVSYSTLSGTVGIVSAGDMLSLDIDSISTAPINLVCHVTVSRTPVDQPSNLQDHDLAL